MEKSFNPGLSGGCRSNALSRAIPPLAPMCRFNANPPFGLRIAPAAKDPIARPDECIYAAAIDDSQFKVPVERRDGDVVPQRKVLSSRQSFPGLRPHACWHFLVRLFERLCMYQAKNAYGAI